LVVWDPPIRALAAGAAGALFFLRAPLGMILP
jgi:hypothetical protein